MIVAMQGYDASGRLTSVPVGIPVHGDGPYRHVVTAAIGLSVLAVGDFLIRLNFHDPSRTMANADENIFALMTNLIIPATGYYGAKHGQLRFIYFFYYCSGCGVMANLLVVYTVFVWRPQMQNNESMATDQVVLEHDESFERAIILRGFIALGLVLVMFYSCWSAARLAGDIREAVVDPPRGRVWSSRPVVAARPLEPTTAGRKEGAQNPGETGNSEASPPA
jgi:hypothetical protein